MQLNIPFITLLSLYFSRNLKLRVFFLKNASWSEEQEVLKMRRDVTQSEKNTTSKIRKKCTYNEGHELLKIDDMVLTLRLEIFLIARLRFLKVSNLRSQKQALIPQQLLNNRLSCSLIQGYKPHEVVTHVTQVNRQ